MSVPSSRQGRSLNITKAQLRGLRKLADPVALTLGPDEILAVWIGHDLKNPMHAGRTWLMYKLTKYKNGWKQQTALALKIAGWRDGVYLPKSPKIITFQPYTANQFDEDGLQLALKWCRDTLVTCGVAHGDAPRDGHTWIYRPSILNRSGKRGVEVRVRLG